MVKIDCVFWNMWGLLELYGYFKILMSHTGGSESNYFCVWFKIGHVFDLVTN